MKRHRPALAVLLLVAALAGCSMCQNPFDYCGPVARPGYRNCDFGARLGSAFAPMDDSSGDEIMGPTPADADFDSGEVSPAAATVEPDSVDTLKR